MERGGDCDCYFCLSHGGHSIADFDAGPKSASRTPTPFLATLRIATIEKQSILPKNALGNGALGYKRRAENG